jgi:hypothetical protein
MPPLLPPLLLLMPKQNPTQRLRILASLMPLLLLLLLPMPQLPRSLLHKRLPLKLP